MKRVRTGSGLCAAPLLPVMLALCLLLTGCDRLPTAREMGDMALLRTMGVDPSPAGVAVTGSTGPRARGVRSQDEPALTLAADRASLGGACLAMQGQSDSYVFFGYVDQLLLGEELAERGVRPVLDYFARNTELGLGAQLWLIRGATAREALASGGEEGADSRLENLRHDSEMGIANITRTAGEVYTDLLELGSAFVPALSPAGDETAVFTERGYGVLRGDTLAGWLEGEEAKGLELLSGGPLADVLEAEGIGGGVSVKVSSAATRSRLIFLGDMPAALKVGCSVEVRLAEYASRPAGEALEAVRTELESRERVRLEAALSRLQSWGTDCTGLGRKAAMAHPIRWESIEDQWPEWFRQLPAEVSVKIKIVG